MPLVDVNGAKQLLDDPPSGLVVLDVRTPDEFAEGHLPGAALVDFYDDGFPARLEALDREVPYLVYCRSGGRSGKTAQLMDQMGFQDVTDLDGGMLAWADAGLPTER
jgi:rhodanese-related sulfurtransferase